MGTDIRLPRVWAGNPGPIANRLYVTSPGEYNGAIAMAVNRTVYQRRRTPAVPISQVDFLVVVQSGNICIAAHAHNSATDGPGTRLATTGSVACPAPGAQTLSLGATVTPEWLSISADNATVSFRAANALGIIITEAGRGLVAYENVFPAPSAPSIAAFVIGGAYVLVGKP